MNIPLNIIEEIEVYPLNDLQALSKQEIDTLFLLTTQQNAHFEQFRRCAFATLVSDLDEWVKLRGEVRYLKDFDNLYKNFKIQLTPRSSGISIKLSNAPITAFVRHIDVNGMPKFELIRGVNDNLFAVCRDLLFSYSEIFDNDRFDLKTSFGKTNAVFNILRHAGVFREKKLSPLVVCWGGHRIEEAEYDYTIKVGYELGLRNIDICTGSGPGVMRGPMEGATIAHAKQRVTNSRYIGLTEPEIISAEPPNPIVNNLILMPDIEKRLEAFVRLGDAYIVFPGGVGTLEEVCYLYGILLDPANSWMSELKFILTGNQDSADYLNLIQNFIRIILGKSALEKCLVIHNAPEKVALEAESIAKTSLDERKQKDNFRVEDADYFRWRINIDPILHNRFDPTHENVEKINFYETEPYLLAGHLRNFFSAVVSGGVKTSGIEEIKRHGRFKVKAPNHIANALETLIASFIAQKRMSQINSEPCFELIA